MSPWARRCFVGAGIVLALGVSGLVCQRVGERGRYALAYSTYGAGPEGARGLFLLVGREGARPERWTEDLAHLPAGAMLVALGGCDHLMSRPLSRAERAHLLAWIEQGGTLVVAGATDYLPSEIGVSMVEPAPEACWEGMGFVGMILRAARRAQPADDRGSADGRGGPAFSVPDPVVLGRSLRQDATRGDESDGGAWPPDPEWALGRAPPLLGMPPVGLRRPARLSFDPSDREITTLLTVADKPVAVSVRRGRGRVIAIASASAFQNRDLVATQGAVLFSRLLREHGGGTVMFDEYHLGAGDRRGAARWLAQRGLMPPLLQLLIVVALLLWQRGARFGAPRPRPPPDPETTASFVSAIGTLFAKSRDPAGAVQILAQHALRRIARHHHLEAQDAERLAEELRRRKREEAAQAVQAIAAVAAEPGRRPARAAMAIDAAVARAITKV